mmetsp:Transcript_11110/g.46200  ORF Transcript_11110/g.46200 Transcript_11110/m.46200 type:complete len:208 (+) Transcript_11110:1710-2333(+)
MSCSLWYLLKISSSMNGVVRSMPLGSAASTPGARSAAVNGAAAPPLRAVNRASRCSILVVSSMFTETAESDILRRFMPSSTAADITLSASPTSRVTQSKNSLVLTPWPSFSAPAARTAAMAWQRLAISLRPSGPWYTPYSPAMFASRACAVQMFEVALSRRMCCSRVCMAMRRPLSPSASTDTPMMRPGMRRLLLCVVARNAACGPP